MCVSNGGTRDVGGGGVERPGGSEARDCQERSERQRGWCEPSPGVPDEKGSNLFYMIPEPESQPKASPTHTRLASPLPFHPFLASPCLLSA